MPDLLLYDSSERSASLRHEVGLVIGDPFLWAQAGGRAAVLTTILERSRLREALPDAELLDIMELGMRSLVVEDGLSREAALLEVVSRAVARLGVTEALVPAEFPLAVADRLRADGVTLAVDVAAFEARRRVKAGRELAGIRSAQKAAEAGMAAAAALLAAATPQGDRLWLGGEELTAERVRGALRDACREHGAPAPPDVIVASVWNGTGHEEGSGPLPAGLPIQIDLWPQDEATGGWADMTRTFVVGEPGAEHAPLIAEQEQLVRAALEDARAAIRPGVLGRELYARTCDRFEAAGFRTQRTGPDPEDPSAGFQFALGHGVGLEVHEAPGLGLAGQDPFVAGDVVAIEPGLWDPRIGGVRYEDLLLVTEAGCETLTDYPYELTPRG